MQKYKLCVVGTGAAGLLTLFCLSHTKIPPEDIVCIDPYHDGGDLQRKWSSILSNTTWNQMLDILRSKNIQPESLPQPWCTIDSTKPSQLGNYIQLLSHLTKSFREKCELVYGTVNSISRENEYVLLTTQKGERFLCKTVLVCTGCEPKLLGYPIPTIPLDVAFSLDRLRTYVNPSQTVLVFGLAHSGTLVLSNLNQLHVTTHAFHKGEKPFLFARDGEYDGIKQESEVIADAILSGSYPKTFLHSLTNTAELIRFTRKADWVIYTTGFQRTSLTSSLQYDGKTGKIEGFPNTWGFGIAFPNQAADGVHWDVSIPSFFAHIENQIPSIVESFYA